MKYLAVLALITLAIPVMAAPSVKPPSHDRYGPLVIASRQVIGPDRLPVGFAHREESKDTFDSGWVFLSGKESQDYLDDSTNLVLSPLELFIEMDPSLSDIVDKSVGTYWERESPSLPWHEIPDYPRGP
jgi:hypothetical protein